MAERLLLLWANLSVTRIKLARRIAAQGLVEYALILLMVALVAVSILSALGYTLCTEWYLRIVGPESPFYAPNATC
jgi:hypothetical protein